MYICVYIYIYVYLSISVFLSLCACVCVCVYVHMYIHLYVSLSLCTAVCSTQSFILFVKFWSREFFWKEYSSGIQEIWILSSHGNILKVIISLSPSVSVTLYYPTWNVYKFLKEDLKNIYVSFTYSRQAREKLFFVFSLQYVTQKMIYYCIFIGVQKGVHWSVWGI